MVRILQAAAHLFSREGFQATTTQQVADRVGVPKATLYYHIASKDELLFLIMKIALEARVERWMPIADATNLPADESFSHLIREHCRLMGTHGESFLVIADELKHLEPTRLATALELRDRTDAIMLDVIERGIADGVFAPTDTRAATLVVMGTINGMSRWYRPNARLDPDEVAEQVTALALGGVAAASGP